MRATKLIEHTGTGVPVAVACTVTGTILPLGGQIDVVEGTRAPIAGAVVGDGGSSVTLRPENVVRFIVLPKNRRIFDAFRPITAGTARRLYVQLCPVAGIDRVTASPLRAMPEDDGRRSVVADRMKVEIVVAEVVGRGGDRGGLHVGEAGQVVDAEHEPVGRLVEIAGVRVTLPEPEEGDVAGIAALDRRLAGLR